MAIKVTARSSGSSGAWAYLQIKRVMSLEDR